MPIAILTFDGFNEADSCVASNVLNRLRTLGRQISIAVPLVPAAWREVVP